MPVQLQMIREYLVEMEGRLSNQMTDMETNLSTQMTGLENALSSQMTDLENNLSTQVAEAQSSLSGQIGNVQSGVDLGNSRLDALQLIANAIYDEAASVSVDVTTQVCLDQNVALGVDGGAHALLGAGWDEVLDVEANFDINAVLAGGTALGSQLCIEIPLFQVVSYAPFESPQLSSALLPIIDGTRVGADAVTQAFATAYTALVPTPEQAMQAINNVVHASPDQLLAPDLLLDPVIPVFIKDFQVKVPTLALEFAQDPCGSLNDRSPFGQLINESDPSLNFMCEISATGLKTTLYGINAAVDGVQEVIWCVTHVGACLVKYFPLIPAS